MQRQISAEQRAKIWWATGDTPVHTDSRVTYLVDGRTAMLEMCIHFLKAKKYIYLANWGLTSSMHIVRGTDHRAGPDGSPEQETLLAKLRAAELQEAEIDFWCTHELTVRSVLGYAVSKGVEVKALVWKGAPIMVSCNTEETHEQLTAEHVDCILDDSSFGILHHPVESLHQKISVVDGTHAFVGGVDLLIENGGDFDRWDTPNHFYDSPQRITPEGTTPHPWHDVHALIEGPAAADVELNFRERWNDVVHRHHMDKHRFVKEHPAPPPVETQTVMQVARTIPEHTYKFKPLIIRDIAQLYANALNNIERFVYLENQYLWLRAYTGINISLLGLESEEMQRNFDELGKALERGAFASIILPDHPNVGRAFSDAGVELLRAKSPEGVEEGRFEAFCLATSHQAEGTTHYRPVYVHAKVAIVDDIWATVGSANLNNRGMRDDTEMNIATLDVTLTHGLRLMLQAEHLGIANSQELFAVSRLLGHQYQQQEEIELAQQVLQRLEELIGDPKIALRMMHNCAWENLRRFKAKLPLVGHLLPYLSEAEVAEEQGIELNGDHGWIEEKS